jgi:hypothetical protein
MIIGAHIIIQSKNPGADRAFIEKLTFPSVSMGDGFTIYGLPPAEFAIHESEKNDVHEFYLMCADIETFVKAMAVQDISCGPVQDQGWGLLTQVMLPGGGKLGVYQPRHARPKPMAAPKRRPRGRSRAGKPSAGKVHRRPR